MTDADIQRSGQPDTDSTESSTESEASSVAAGGPQNAATLTVSGPTGWRRWLALFLRWREAGVLLAVVGLAIYFESTTSQFMTESNYINLSQYVAAIAILATGEVLLLVSGQLDLSVGSVFAFTPFVMLFAVQDLGMPVLLGIVVALLVAGMIGLANGLITVHLGVPPFVTTMGMLFVVSGITLTTMGAFPEAIPTEAQDLQPWLGAAPWAQICWALLIVAAFHLVLTRTRWGLHTVATGGNPHAASEAGVRTSRIKIGNFVICSALAGFAGTLEAFRIDTIDATAGGTEIMFYAIAAAVIGGTALAGGSGTVLGALLGATVLGVLQVGLNLAGVDAYAFQLVLGAAIVVTMIANVRLTQLRRTGGL